MVDDILREVPLQLLQFHGDEREDECLRYERPLSRPRGCARGLI